MSTETNKEVVREFMRRFSAGDAAGLLDMLAEDATWWVAGRRKMRWAS